MEQKYKEYSKFEKFKKKINKLFYKRLYKLFIFITLSSQSNGKWRTISKGVVSAAIIINSAIPLLSVLVASLAPFLT